MMATNTRESSFESDGTASEDDDPIDVVIQADVDLVAENISHYMFNNETQRQEENEDNNGINDCFCNANFRSSLCHRLYIWFCKVMNVIVKSEHPITTALALSMTAMMIGLILVVLSQLKASESKLQEPQQKQILSNNPTLRDETGIVSYTSSNMTYRAYSVELRNLILSSPVYSSGKLIDPDSAPCQALDWMTRYDPIMNPIFVADEKRSDIESGNNGSGNVGGDITERIYSSLNNNKDRIFQRYALVTLYYHWSSGRPSAWNFLKPEDGWPLNFGVGINNNAAINSEVVYAMDECQWLAVECSSNDGGKWSRVTGLHIGISSIPAFAFAGNTIPEEIAFLKHLKNLDLSQQGLKGSFPEVAYHHLTSLEMLDVSHNALTNVGLSHALSHLTLLRIVNLQDNRLHGDLHPAAWHQLNDLQEIRLGDNPKLKGRLFGLDESQNESILDTTPNTPLLSYPKLQVLDISDTSLSGNLPTLIGNWTSLRILGASRSHLSGSLPSEMAHCTMLQRISLGDLSGRGLQGTIPSQLGDSLTNLHSFSVRHADLTGTIPTELGSLQALQTLDLFDNNLEGTLPSELGQLNQMLVFNVAKNRHLTGSIPTELALSTKLYDAKFHKTGLTGTMPEGLCDLNLGKLTANCGIPRNSNTSVSCSCCTECFRH